jgi:hypothetical protein
MALQGTLDTFELPDVLRLLASTRKTGRLTLRSDRGQGDVWLADGRLVGAEAGGSGEVADALFELLRAHEGSFAFEPGDAPASPREPADVEPLLVSAEELLVEWREIEAVVPSVGAWVALEPDLPSAEVTVDADTWRLVATIGGGLTVAALGDALGLGEVAVSRVVRDLVGLGLGAVTAAPAHAVRPPAVEAQPEPVYEPAPAPVHEIDAVAEPVVGPAFERAPSPLFAPEPEPVAFVPEPAAEPVSSPFAVAPEPADDTDDVARHLALLSPQAAQAVAAASAHDGDGGAVADDLDEGDEPVNRGLLLKFLGSVKA